MWLPKDEWEKLETQVRRVSMYHAALDCLLLSLFPRMLASERVFQGTWENFSTTVDTFLPDMLFFSHSKFCVSLPYLCFLALAVKKKKRLSIQNDSVLENAARNTWTRCNLESALSLSGALKRWSYFAVPDWTICSNSTCASWVNLYSTDMPCAVKSTERKGEKEREGNRQGKRETENKKETEVAEPDGSVFRQNKTEGNRKKGKKSSHWKYIEGVY